MSIVADFVESVFDLVGDVIEGVGNAVVNVVEFVVDEIVEPVFKVVGNVIESALDDPIKTIAQVVAVATGNAWALPLIEGVDVAIAGGDVGDVLEATAKAYVMQQVGSYVGSAAGSYAGEAAANAGASAAAAKVAENVVGSAVGSAAVAVVAGQDPVKAFITGGVGAAVPAALGQVSGFQQLPGAAQRVIASAVSAQLTGQNVTAAVVNSAVAASGIVTDILNSYDPKGDKLDNTQRAIITDVLMGTATAAITGGNPSNVVRAAMVKAGSAALGQMVSDTFKTSTTETVSAYNRASAKASEIETNEGAQQTAASNYNRYANELRGRIDRQTELLDARTRAVNAYNANTTDANYNAAQAATDAYNAHVTALNKDYAEYFKPNLDKFGSELDRLKQTHGTLTSDYQKLVQDFSTKTDTLTNKLDPIYFTSDRAFVEAMSPGFNPEEYRKINGLSAGDDVYDHYLAKGQFQGLPTNLKDAQTEIIGQRTRLVNEALAAKGVTLATADPDQIKKILDNINSSYGDNVVALRGASAQDIIKGNTTTLDKLVSDQNSGVLRIDASGIAYGAWEAPPSSEGFTPPPGTRYATQQEFDNSTAKMVYTKNGNAVYIMDDPAATAQGVVWDAKTGSHVRMVSEAVKAAPSPTMVDKILAYGTNPSSWQGAVGSAVISASRTLVDWSKSTGNSTIINTAANVIKAGGGFLESINGISVLAGHAPKNTALGKFADALQQIGKAGNTAEYQAAIKNMQGMIGDAKGVGGTLKAIYGAFKSAPLEFLAEYVGVEGIQEIAPLLIGGVVASGAKGATLALKYGEAVAARIGAGAGLSAAITTDIIESAGGSAKSAYDEAYRSAIKAGKSAADADKIALDIAQRSALVAAGTTAVSMGVGGAAIERALLGRTGTGLGDALQSLGDFAKTGTKIAIREGVAEGGEEGVIQAYLEGQLYKLDPTRDVAGNITAAAAFGAIAGGPIAGGAYAGSRTGDVISNALMANPTVANTINNAPNATVAAQELAKLGVSDTVTQANLLNTKFDSAYTSSDEAQTALAQRNDFTYSAADIDALTGATSDTNLANAVEQYVDPRVVDIGEVKAVAAAEGYTISDEEAAALIGQKDEASAITAARAQFDPLATTYDEAKSFFTSRGYTPSADEIRQFVGSKLEADQTKAVAEYVNPRQVTTEEARKYLTDLGYTPTDAEVSRFVGQVNEAEQATKIGEYVDPRLVDEGEVKAAYELLGLKKPTADDVKKLVGQYAESDLTGKAEAYLPTARYNSIIEQIDALASGAASQDVLNAIDTVKRDFNAQLADLGVDISKVSSEVGATKDALIAAIGDAQKGNTTRFGDIDKAIADLKAAGLTEAQVQKIVDDSAAGVSKDFKAALDAAVKGNSEALTKVQEDLTTKIGDVQTALETKLGDQKTAFDAKVKELMDQGKTYQEATETALKDIGVQITDLGTDFATKLKDTSDALGKQIGDLSTQLKDAESNILTKMAEYEKAGISRDEALSKAVDAVAKDLGTTKEDLLKQIGTTEESLSKRVTDVETSLGTKITESQEAVLKELGLVKVGLSEEIAGVKQDLTTKIGDVETNILNRVADYEKAGISRDEALGRAVDDVAAQLGTTRDELLKQIGDTETALKGDISNVKQEVLDRAAEYEKAGVARDEALTRAVADTEQRLGTKIGDLQTTIGQKATPATQQDLDAIINLLQQQGAYDPQYDYNGDRVIDQKDKIAIETVLRSQQPDYKPDPNQPFRFAPAAGTKWASTGIFGEIDASQLATERAIAEEAARTRAAQEQAALKTQRLGNLNTLMSMLGQAGDIGGQQVNVKAADPAKIGYIYDWSSIFANPSQEKLFASPYAQGGAVRSEVDDVNEELLKILRG